MGKINDLLKNLNLNEDVLEDLTRDTSEALEKIMRDTETELKKYDFYFSQKGPVEKMQEIYHLVMTKKSNSITEEAFDDVITELKDSITDYIIIVKETIDKLKTLKDTYSKKVEDYNK